MRAEDPAKQTPEQVLEPVLEHLRKDDIPHAFAEMSILGLASQSPDQIEERMLGFKRARLMSGKSLGELELIDSNRVGTRIARLTYLEYSEKLPMVWKFTMYRGSKQWWLLNVSWKHDYEDLFDKSKTLSQKPEASKH